MNYAINLIYICHLEIHWTTNVKGRLCYSHWMSSFLDKTKMSKKIWLKYLVFLK